MVQLKISVFFYITNISRDYGLKINQTFSVTSELIEIRCKFDKKCTKIGSNFQDEVYKLPKKQDKIMSFNAKFMVAL